MKRGRGRPPKTPTALSRSSRGGRAEGSKHGGHWSPAAHTQSPVKTRGSAKPTARKVYNISDESSGSDSDEGSVCSFTSTSTTATTFSSTYDAETWNELEQSERTPLPLPPSSFDLPLSSEYILQALTIYEVLRQYSRVLRLSVFRFEDFCAALEAQEQSCLLSQVHIALFKALLSEDEASSISFGPNDERDSINIYLYLLDNFSWPELVRSYIASDREFVDALRAVEQECYPFALVDHRIRVLSRLCDQFVASDIVREEIMNEGSLLSEDHCRNCYKMGDLLCCETCPAVFHLHCLKPPLLEVPDGDWLCPLCVCDQVKGVTECHVDWNKTGYLRNTPLGQDRHGRKYWFLARRLFV